MEYLTYSAFKARVEKRLDLEEEVFIQDSEFLEYTHDAIDRVEAMIHKFRASDVYFETCAPLALVDGQEDFQLPSDIYANKIRKIIYQKNDDIFEITRLTRKERYIDDALRRRYSSDRWYKYMVLNTDPRVKPFLRFTPRCTETTTVVSLSATTTVGSAVLAMASTTGVSQGQFVAGTGIPANTKVVSVVTDTSVTVSAPAYAAGTATLTFTDPDCLLFYIRNAAKPTADTDVIDIPEWGMLVQQYVVVDCLSKEPNNPRFPKEMATLERMIEDAESTLADMVPDQNDSVEIDNSIYQEMS